MPAEAVLRALQHVWLTLQSLNIPAAVVGGIAMAVWRHVRATRDVDVLLNIGDSDPDQLFKKLREAGIRPRDDARMTSVGQLDVVRLLYEPPDTHLDLQIDLLLARSEYHRNALDRRVPARLPDLDVEIAVLACEDLILHKLISGRIIDRADAAALMRANGDTLRMDYLLHWIGKLQLATELKDVWDEAFPGKPPPVI